MNEKYTLVVHFTGHHGVQRKNGDVAPIGAMDQAQTAVDFLLQGVCREEGLDWVCPGTDWKPATSDSRVYRMINGSVVRFDHEALQADTDPIRGTDEEGKEEHGTT